MNISLEKLIELIVKEVVVELSKRGTKIISNSINQGLINNVEKKFDGNVKLDFIGYKTPLVTEEKIMNLDKCVKEITVPAKTIFTPSAMDLIKTKNIKINKNSD